jgi:hypothetical protein
MYRCSACINFAIPGECRKSAERLFPAAGFFQGQGPDIKAAADFAEALGIGPDYRRLLSLHASDEEMRSFLCHFQNNLDLLIQKTWVEKTDEERKERLQDELPGLVTVIRQGNFQQALETFSGILEELAYLLFGAQSAQDDFTEYTFRIDTQMGLFWWYGGRLGALREAGGSAADDGVFWALLLIGICYLTNF